MKTQTGKSPAACLMLLAAASAHAADKGFYITAGAGPAEERPGESDGLNFSAGVPPFNLGIVHVDPDWVRADDGDTGWGIGVGYRFARHLAAELEYIDFGTTEITEHYTLPELAPFFPDEAEFTHRGTVTGPAVSVLGILPIGKSFEIHVRGGVLFADREITSEISQDGPTVYGDEVWLAGVGVDWSFAQRFGVRAEYQRSDEIDVSAYGTTRSAVEWLSLRVRFTF